jgi:hypothetical protein
MDSDWMLCWFKGIILPYLNVKKKRALLVVDSFSAHENNELAHANNVDVSIIPGGCTSKIQPLDVCLNKPFKGEYVDAKVAATPNLEIFTTAPKVTICEWINAGADYLKVNIDMVMKSFFVMT